MSNSIQSFVHGPFCSLSNDINLTPLVIVYLSPWKCVYINYVFCYFPVFFGYDFTLYNSYLFYFSNGSVEYHEMTPGYPNYTTTTD